MSEKKKPSTDVIRRVFDEEGTNFIEIGPWPDSIDFVELRTVVNKHSSEHFGRINLALTPDFAEEVGKSLIKAAADIRDRQ